MAIPIKAILSVSAKGFNIGMKTATKAVGGLVAITKMAAFAIAGLTAAFTAIILRQTAYIDRIGKVSKVTGVAAETLQKFSFAAELAGVSTDQAQVALRRFSRRLGEAQRNTGELAPTLRRLGIDVKNADGSFRSAEEVLFDLSDAIANTENESEALSIAFKAFDSEGAELVNVLNQGSDAMRELFSRAEALGGVLTTQAIQGVENFNDSLNELQTLIGGVSNNFVAALAPALEQATNDFVDFILKTAEANGGMENFGNFLKNEFLDIVIAVTKGLVFFTNLIISLFNAIGEGLVSIDKLPGIDLGLDDVQQRRIEELQQQLEDLADARADLSAQAIADLGPPPIRQFPGVVQPGNRFPTPDPRDVQALEDYNEKLRLIMTGVDLPGMDELNNRIIAIRQEIGDLQQTENPFFIDTINVDAVIQYLEGLKSVLSTAEENQEVTEEELTLLEKIRQFFDQLPDKIKAAGEAMKDFRDQTIDLETVLENVAQRLGTPMERLQKTLEDGLVKGVEIFEDTLANAIVQGKADFSALGDHIKQVLAKALVQRFITGPILAAFGLAAGGPAQAGRPYIVGEEGPELFVPNTSGTVIPNDQITSTGGMGMGGPTIINNISAIDTLDFQTRIAQDPEFIYAVTRAGARRIPGGG